MNGTNYEVPYCEVFSSVCTHLSGVLFLNPFLSVCNFKCLHAVIRMNIRMEECCSINHVTPPLGIYANAQNLVHSFENMLLALIITTKSNKSFRYRLICHDMDFINS